MTTNFTVLFTILFFVIFLNAYGQNNISTNEQHFRHDKDYEKNFNIAEQNLKKAQSDKDRATFYLQMGDAEYKMMKYSDAIKHFKEANYYAQKSNFITIQFSANAHLSNIYNLIGITEQAEDAWKTAWDIAQKIGDPENKYVLYGIKAINLGRKEKFCKAIEYDTLIYEFNKKEYNRTQQLRLKYDYLASCNYLTYLQLKCGNTPSAKKLLEEYESVYNPSTDYKGHYFLEYYYLSKALIYVKEDKIKEAQNWFDKAVERASSNENKGSLENIIRERLLYNIGDGSSEKKYFKEYLELRTQAIKEASLAYNEELQHQKENTKQQLVSTKVMIAVSMILAALIVIILYYNSQRKKQLKSRFEAIIRNLEQHNSIYNQSQFQENTLSPHKEKTAKSKVRVSESKEAELLERLMLFESGKEFTSPNFTISNLASLLETNVKYTNYILKTHRGKIFNEYINGLRIAYITQLLYNEPKYLSYKINYLSDLAGFATHSHFAKVFKKELNISPSEFISQLSEKTN